MENGNKDNLFFRKSLFSNVPPYIRFLEPGNSYKENQFLPISWSAPSGMDQVLTEVLKHAGFEIVEVLYIIKNGLICINICLKGQRNGVRLKYLASIWDQVASIEKDYDEIKYEDLSSEVIKINCRIFFDAVGV